MSTDWRMVLSILWFALAMPAPAQQVWRSSDSILAHEMAIDGAAFYLAWTEQGPDATRVLVSRSLDHGRTWDPQTLLHVDRAEVGKPVWGLIVVAGQGEVHVFWHKLRVWPVVEQWHARSMDRGATWTVDTLDMISTGVDQALLVGNALLLVEDALSYRSVDGGRTWSPPIRIGNAGRNVSPEVAGMHLAETGGRLLAAWWEWTPQTGPDWAYLGVSTDGGLTWQTPDRVLSSPGATGSGGARLLVSEEKVFLTWSEAFNNGLRLSFDRSLDNGRTWLQTPICLSCLTRGNRDILPAFDGDSLIGIYTESSTIGNTVSFFNLRSPDLGASWQAAGQPFLVYNFAGRFLRWAVPGAGGGLFLVSTNTVSTTFLPYSYVPGMTASVDGGATWFGPHGPVMRRFHFGLGDTPGMEFSGTALYGHWLDYRYGQPANTLKFEWVAGPRPLGGGVAGSEGLRPVLSLDRTPVLGHPFELRVRQARGGAPALLVLGMASPPVPLLGGQLHVQPGLALYLPLYGVAGAAGAGEGGVRIGPAIQSWLTEFSVQAFVLDPSAPQGVAMTDAVEIRLL